LSNVNDATYPLYLKQFSQGIPEIMDVYAASNFASPREALLRLTSEGVFQCPARRMARYVAAQNVPVFSYTMNHGPRHGLLANMPWTGAFHYSDVPFVFGQVDGRLVTSFDADEVEMGNRMRRFWLNFAESVGNANAVMSIDEYGQMDSVWPQYRADLDESIVFDVGTSLRTATAVHKTRCDVWDKYFLGPYAPQPQSSNNVPTSGSPSTTSSETKDRADTAFGVSIAALALAVLLMLVSIVMCCRARSASAQSKSSKFAEMPMQASSSPYSRFA
jgi:hypothetical protein